MESHKPVLDLHLEAYCYHTHFTLRLFYWTSGTKDVEGTIGNVQILKLKNYLYKSFSTFHLLK